MSNNLELPNIKEVVDLRVELIFKKKCTKFYKGKKAITPVQGDSVNIYLKVTNTSDKVFQGAKVENFKLENKTSNMTTEITKDVQLKALNPNESLEQQVDWTTFTLDGVYWVTLLINPLSKTQDVMTYQFDSAHSKEEKFEINHWGNTYYLEGKLATLQTKTNNYILLLTCITVWEAIFGIKATLSLLLSSLSEFFSLLSMFFDAASKIT